MVTAKRSRDRFPTDHCAGVPGRDPNQQHAESDLEHGGWRGVSVAIHFRLEFDQLDQPGQPRHGSRCDAQHDRLRHERPATVLPAGALAVVFLDSNFNRNHHRNRNLFNQKGLDED